MTCELIFVGGPAAGRICRFRDIPSRWVEVPKRGASGIECFRYEARLINGIAMLIPVDMADSEAVARFIQGR